MNGVPLKYINLTKDAVVGRGDILYIRPDITKDTLFERRSMCSIKYWRVNDGTESYGSDIWLMPRATMDFLLANKGKKMVVSFVADSNNAVQVEAYGESLLTTMLCKRNDDTKRIKPTK